jgi:hypothetical protein
LEQQKSTNYISVESEADFCTVSGNTVIFVQENGAPQSADEKIQISLPEVIFATFPTSPARFKFRAELLPLLVVSSTFTLF